MSRSVAALVATLALALAACHDDAAPSAGAGPGGTADPKLGAVQLIGALRDGDTAAARRLLASKAQCPELAAVVGTVERCEQFLTEMATALPTWKAELAGFAPGPVEVADAPAGAPAIAREIRVKAAGGGGGSVKLGAFVLHDRYYFVLPTKKREVDPAPTPAP